MIHRFWKKHFPKIEVVMMVIGGCCFVALVVGIIMHMGDKRTDAGQLWVKEGDKNTVYWLYDDGKAEVKVREGDVHQYTETVTQSGTWSESKDTKQRILILDGQRVIFSEESLGKVPMLVPVGNKRIADRLVYSDDFDLHPDTGGG